MSANTVPAVAPERPPERMIPYETTLANEMMHWQRYLFFRPWYEGNKVVDAACGEGYGIDYASVFATEATGYDISEEAVQTAKQRYPATHFACSDVCDVDYTDADLVLSFSTISCIEQPERFLNALGACEGRIVISAPNRIVASPDNGPDDKPLNPYHAKEWTPAEFAALIRDHFPDRTVRFLSQEVQWPALIREGLDDQGSNCIAVIGDGALPQWPRIGVAMPTCNNASGAADAIIGMSRFYPGEIEFAVVCNGTDKQNLDMLTGLRKQAPQMITVIEEHVNLGYGVGANRGLAYLANKGGFDYFMVTNDDVVPATDCMNELVAAMGELDKLGHNPGVIGPVSNNVNGAQQVEVGSYSGLAEMLEVSRPYHRVHAGAVSQVLQVRGLCLLIHPKCLETIGGFDPCFGLGNFEDDDHNLRTRLAGFTLWIAEGAYLFHAGSTTFKSLKIDYQASILRNSEVLASKWGLTSSASWATMTEKPEGVELYIPLQLDTRSADRYVIAINGQPVDLLREASDVEFAGWVMHELSSRPRDCRRAVIEILDDRRSA